MDDDSVHMFHRPSFDGRIYFYDHAFGIDMTLL